MATPSLNASIVSPKEPPPPNKQLTVFVTIHVAPSDIEKFKEAHRPIWKKCSEEPECLFFDVFQDPEEQMTKPYYESLWTKSKPLWTEDIRIEYFEREGEGCAWSDEYLVGGNRMEKDEVVA
ncbi:hypothetical protein IFR05_009323 [Cadophora sp. M221]|nr:hypothetical protein IFR05_009323 [Cadophora sp. M221]